MSILRALLLCLALSYAGASAEDAPIYNVKVHDLPFSHHPGYATFRELLNDHPQVRYKRHTQLQIPNVSRGSLLMSIAGGTAPDILRVAHHEAKSWIRNGFLAPLDAYVYRDMDGDGRFTEGTDIITWEPLQRMRPELREIVMDDGHFYMVPRFQWIQGIIYRKDLLREHGIDPEAPIRTFDQLKYVSQKLTDPNAKVAGARRPVGRKGFAVFPDGWMWQGYMFAAGGKASHWVRICPDCRTPNTDDGLETVDTPRCTQCDTPLGNVARVERAAFNTEAGVRALQLWKDLLWGPFIKCPACTEPIDLGGADADLQWPVHAPCEACGTSTLLESPADSRIIIGCARPCIGEDRDWRRLFVNGEIAMFSRHREFLVQLAEANLDSRLVGFMPLPENGGLTAYHYWGVYAGAEERRGGKDRVKTCAEFILDYSEQFFVPREDPRYLKYDRHKALALAEKGFFNLCTRDELLAAGLDEYIKEIPAGSLRMQEMLYDPAHTTIMPATEGYSRVQIQVFGTELLSDLVISPNYDVREELSRAEKLANSQVYEKDEQVRELQQRFRIPFILIMLALAAYVGFIFYWYVFRESDRITVANGRRLSFGKRTAGVVMLLPAVALIGLWAYYPLARGSIMAFQNVRIMGGSDFVGIENFIRVLTNPQFVTMLRATVMYVLAVLTLGFTVPIVLALLLSEVRRLSIFFRVLYYAPHLMTGAAVLFIWRIFYSPTPDGFLNQVLDWIEVDLLIAWLNTSFDLRIQFPVHWLQNTSVNKWALALPPVWANAGSACLIYLAALKSIDDEIYEAAEIDGAGTWQKIRNVTIPCLKPLLIIQFVGAFIGAFQGMGNILILTGGAYDTNVVGLQIFLESFAFLRFGAAISLAWLLGSVLVSFTVFQLNILKKVEFRRAQ